MDQPDQDLQDILQTLDPTSRLLAAEFDLGKDVEEFLNSPVGRSLRGMAQQELMDALLQLETVAWWRRRKIMELQARAKNARQFCTWLRELLIRGRQAERLLKDND